MAARRRPPDRPCPADRGAVPAGRAAGSPGPQRPGEPSRRALRRAPGLAWMAGLRSACMAALYTVHGHCATWQTGRDMLDFRPTEVASSCLFPRTRPGVTGKARRPAPARGAPPMTCTGGAKFRYSTGIDSPNHPTFLQPRQMRLWQAAGDVQFNPDLAIGGQRLGLAPQSGALHPRPKSSVCPAYLVHSAGTRCCFLNML